MTKKGSVYIGTSGWSYKEWKDNFYPPKTKAADYLEYYSSQFKTVEINSSFYHVLKDENVQHWYQTVPDDFVFAVKADRYITHNEKLEKPEETIPPFIQSLHSFKDKLGPILFQLPPSFRADNKRLEAFLENLPKDYQYVFEFRNKTWFNDETYQILEKNRIALCLYNIKGYDSPRKVTGDFAYFRYHGTLGLGSGKYTKEEIEKLSDEVKKLTSQGKKVYCYFNNTSNGNAVQNARELLQNL